MGNTEDLEEFDAELEIALKREYADVFALFKYCVVTAESTYLCNNIVMDCVPHAGYLLFEIRMEDVWVWDRNRPRRIIPRAQIYTTADVTVEQLKDDAEAASEFASSLPKNVMDQLRTAYEIEESGEEEDSEASEGAEGEEAAAGGKADDTAAASDPSAD